VLLSELDKLQLDSRKDLIQAISKSLRAIRRRSFIEKVQKQLEEYRRILDTRILVRLDANSLQQRQDFQSLDQSVRNLVGAMSKGQNTFSQLLADNRQILIDHFDRGLASHAQLKRDSEARLKFKDSLFFPEILARQEQISDAHLGTCRWIFCGADSSLEGIQAGGREDINSNQYLAEQNYWQADKDRVLPWSDFADWLENGEKVYWINGKPGSGKSTLMNFITSEDRTKELLKNWSKGGDLITVSFFFWNPGTTLQKTFQGLLRSLLYQIADQRQDLISTMMDQGASLVEGPGNSPDRFTIHSWTEKRLLSVLQHFLIHKPPSISICIFIDGLDEFVGEEEKLINTIRLLNDTKQVKVCTSSRWEQLFLQEFKHSPQLRLQDFNHQDISNTAFSKLRSALAQLFPDENDRIRNLIRDVCVRAQGVFLWLDLMIKDILRGARNGDTLQELAERLQSMPDTIEELYKHMLKRLDKHYLLDAAKFFRFLLACPSPGQRSTVMHFVCAEYPIWQRVLEKDLTYFESAEFFNTCHKLEIRILTRCAGFAEISEHQTRLPDTVGWSEDYPEVSEQHGEVISRYFREVSFVHRTAIEFLESHFEDFFQEPNWRSKGRLAYANSQLGCLSIIPCVLPPAYIPGRRSVCSLIKDLMYTMSGLDDFVADEQIDQSFEDAAVEIISHSFRVISHVCKIFGSLAVPWYECYKGGDIGWSAIDQLPFHNCHGFAAFFDCRTYISRYLSSHASSRVECTYLLKCSLIGFACRGFGQSRNGLKHHRFYLMMGELLRQEIDANLPIYLRQSLSRAAYEVSLWGLILLHMMKMVLYDGSDQASQSEVCASLVEKMLTHGSNINTSMFWEFATPLAGVGLGLIVLEESALSFIERYRTQKGLHSLKKTTDLLRSRGALQRQRCRLIKPPCFSWNGLPPKLSLYQLSLNQSGHLFDAYGGRFPIDFVEDVISTAQGTVIVQVIKEMKTSLEEADTVVDNTFVLRPSFRSDDGKG
jgi:NACHT domain